MLPRGQNCASSVENYWARWPLPQLRCGFRFMFLRLKITKPNTRWKLISLISKSELGRQLCSAKLTTTQTPSILLFCHSWVVSHVWFKLHPHSGWQDERKRVEVRMVTPLPVICICNHSHPIGQKLVARPYLTAKELNIVFLCKIYSKYSFSYGCHEPSWVHLKPKV